MTSRTERRSLDVTFFVPNYAPSVGGAQSHVRQVAEGLVARHGHRVSVVTTDALLPPASRSPGRTDAADGWLNGVWVRRLPVPHRTHDLIRLARRIRRRLYRGRRAGSLWAHGPAGLRWAGAMFGAARRSDVVVGVSAPFTTLLGADLAARPSGAAFVAMPLLHLSDGPPRNWVLRSIRRAHGCSVNTTYEGDWLVQRGVRRDRIAVLPPGCEPDAFDDMQPSHARAKLHIPERLTVGFMGRLAAHKGIDTLIEAFPLIRARRPEAQLLIAGARTRWDVDAAIERLPDEHRSGVVLKAEVAEGEKSTVLAACDVVAFPSRSESFGMVTVEAWCARRPVVAGDIDSVRSLINPGVDGELVPLRSAGELARAVVGLLDDPERRRSYGSVGRKRAESEFAWDGIVDDWHELLLAAVQRRGGKRRAGSAVRAAERRDADAG